MSLIVERLHNCFHSPVPLDAARCESWQAALADRDGEALVAGMIGEEEWLLIRRLPLSMRWRADSSDSDVGQQWDTALRHAMEQELAKPGNPNVIRYTSRRTALADLLYRSALGERTRQWAWQRIGLIARDNISPAEALEIGVTLLLRETELIWPVLHRLVIAEPDTAALTAILRAIPGKDWQRLFSASPQTAGYARLIAAPAVTSAISEEHSWATGEPTLPGTGAARTLLNWAAARRYFAALHADTLTVLIAALAWPAKGTGERALQARLSVVQASLDTALGRHKKIPDHGDAQIPHAPAEADLSATHKPAPAVRDSDDLPPLPALPEQTEWLLTHWAGALFWLGRLSASGILEQIDTQHETVPMQLRAIATALGVAADDAALRAFCGGEVPQSELSPACIARATALIAEWSAWLDKAAPELPQPRLTAVCQRGGRLRYEAGWIELHLPLDSVNTAIRRLGLDLDPGWLPWLGCVLRICYDE